MKNDQSLIPRDMKTVTPEEMVETFGFSKRPEFQGRCIFKSGNYHPVKFVHGILKASLKHADKLFFTNTKVLSIDKNQHGVKMVTAKQTIHAGKVIVATNAFTPFVLPEFKGIITCTPSQILNMEHVRQNLKGITVTEKEGEIYYNFPQSRVYTKNGQTFGMLHHGFDFDHEVDNPYHIRRSLPRFRLMLEQIQETFAETRHQPPSRCWAGPLGMTSDRTPLIGFVHPHIIVGAGFNGFGGSWCVETGYVTAQMAKTGQEHHRTPPTIFSPLRFFQKPEIWRPGRNSPN